MIGFYLFIYLLYHDWRIKKKKKKNQKPELMHLHFLS